MSAGRAFLSAAASAMCRCSLSVECFSGWQTVIGGEFITASSDPLEAKWGWGREPLLVAKLDYIG